MESVFVQKWNSDYFDRGNPDGRLQEEVDDLERFKEIMH